MKKQHVALLAIAGLAISGAGAKAQNYIEMYRPQYHFTPAMNWMNDPNGLVYYKGKYNLFFQYNPSGSNWGNISWGHAAAPDLLRWTQLALALPFLANTQGQQTQLNFSGSAVADVYNTSGLGTPGHPPLVAIYTAYYPMNVIVPDGRFVQSGTQAQALAYSVDDGVTWTQYSRNPILPLPANPYQAQYQNFRDPKVFWHAPTNKWIMVASLAALHEVILYSSTDLKHWTPMSTFGPANAIGGVWECPDLFPLPIDGDTNNVKWVLMLGLNPGALAGGSGTQYFLGQFDGTRFTADASSLSDANAPAGSIVIQDFNGSSYSGLGWTPTGDLVGTGPAPGALGGQQTVTGYHGGFFVDTFESGDGTEGTLTSPKFTVAKKFINFEIGGGYHPYNPSTYGTSADTETSVNLLVNGQVVQSATGSNDEHLGWRSWNVSGYVGQTAQIQIVDANNGGWGHINADYFVASDVAKVEANWLDHGPDFYAAASWNGLPAMQRTAIAWMNNWNYGGNIPTSPWRSAMSLPRQFSLQTINGQVRLTQQPLVGLPNLWGAALVANPNRQVIMPGTWTAPINGATGEALDISAVFTPGTASQFGFKVRTGINGEQTIIGYDTKTHQVFVDRFQSGQTGFDPTFPGRYAAPLEPDAEGGIRLRILVDWSSVEVFGGAGDAVLTTQIFPSPSSTGVSVFATGGYAALAYVGIRPVNSVWPTN